MYEETRRLKYGRAIESARLLLSEKPGLSLAELRRQLQCSEYVAKVVLRELARSSAGVHPLEAFRKMLTESSAWSLATLSQESGLSKKKLTEMLRALPQDDPALRAFRIRHRHCRRNLRLEAEAPVAKRLEEHLLTGGTFGTFANQQQLSAATVGRIFSRHLGHLEYSRSKSRDPAVAEKIRNVCALAGQGLSTREISEQLSIPREDVYSILHRYAHTDQPIRRLFTKTHIAAADRARRKEEKKGEILRFAEQVLDLRSTGGSLREIARRFGIRYSLLYWRLKKAEELYPNRFPPGWLRSERKSPSAIELAHSGKTGTRELQAA